jgi:hypothetical protein
VRAPTNITLRVISQQLIFASGELNLEIAEQSICRSNSQSIGYIYFIYWPDHLTSCEFP